MRSQLEVVERLWRCWAGWDTFSDDESEGLIDMDHADTYDDIHCADLEANCLYDYLDDWDLDF